MQLENVPEEYILPRGAPQVAAANNCSLLITEKGQVIGLHCLVLIREGIYNIVNMNSIKQRHSQVCFFR